MIFYIGVSGFRGTNHLLPVGEKRDGGEKRGLREGSTDDANPKPLFPHLEHKTQKHRHGDSEQVEGAEVDVRAHVLPPASSSDA